MGCPLDFALSAASVLDYEPRASASDRY